MRIFSVIQQSRKLSELEKAQRIAELLKVWSWQTHKGSVQFIEPGLGEYITYYYGIHQDLVRDES